MLASKKELRVIGSKIYVDFPDQDLEHVPAKVDTGAYTSSIWASNISEKKGRLDFSLFAPGSPFYTGKIISTKTYQIRSVKNSFGQTERRYMVYLKTKIEGKIVKIRFSLANRAFNTYPVLIGRRTVRGKFIIDVNSLPNPKKRHVLVFDEKAAEHTPVLDQFKSLNEDFGLADFTITDYTNLKFLINNNIPRVELLDSKKDIASFDIAFFKTSVTSRDIATVAGSYLDANSITLINRAVLKHFTNNKLKQYIVLAFGGVKVPKTCYIPNPNFEKSYNDLAKELGSPFIIKSIRGKKGRNNYLIHSKAEFQKACEDSKNDEVDFVAQEYIENDGDYRLLIMGPQARLIIKRRAVAGQHVNNTSAGASAELIDKKDFPSFIQNMAVTAAKLMELDIAGVDMIQDKKSGKWYCLEVNSGPQISTGAFIKEKDEQLREYLIKRINKLV